jgi:2-hydroxychromene-2-carboxylate isomerase
MAEKVKPFAKWLDDQKPLRAQAQKRGWTVEDFVREAQKKGVNCRVQTAYKWRRGATPRPSFQDGLRRAFPTIRF